MAVNPDFCHSKICLLKKIWDLFTFFKRSAVDFVLMQEELKQIRMSWEKFELLEKLHLQIFVNTLPGVG